MLGNYFQKLLMECLVLLLYYGIMVDETTDTSTSQQLIIYIKFLDRKEHGLLILTVKYLDLVSSKSGSAEDLTVLFLLTLINLEYNTSSTMVFLFVISEVGRI